MSNQIGHNAAMSCGNLQNTSTSMLKAHFVALNNALLCGAARTHTGQIWSIAVTMNAYDDHNEPQQSVFLQSTLFSTQLLGVCTSLYCCLEDDGNTKLDNASHLGNELSLGRVALVIPLSITTALLTFQCM